MKTKCRLLSMWSPAFVVGLSVLLVMLGLVPVSMHAQSAKNNPVGKVFVAEVHGDVQILIGGRLEPLKAKSVYNAEGIVIETGEDESVTLVFSNGTSFFLDSNTRIEVTRFAQEPFTPNRTDMEVEPSISIMHIVVTVGTVSVSSSKLVAGSSMTFQTRDATLNTLGGEFVIHATDESTRISILAGDGTVRGGSLDLGGNTIRAGQQAIIQHGPVGGSNRIEIAVIPPTESTRLDDNVAVASMAAKTVYFQVTERTIAVGGAPSSPEAAIANAAANTDSTASGSNTDRPVGSALVTAFDSPPVNSSSATRVTIVQEIVAVPVVPSNLPVQFTVSPARIVTPTPRG